MFVGLAARHKADPPRHGQHHPDANGSCLAMSAGGAPKAAKSMSTSPGGIRR
ncbi:hypothetical protein [Streptomyces sp. MH13]|uniref:hypothetical protein n=1 Tax=Streptomyces sp. MH13 TaxID=3417651 RepID=UPI003CEEDD12